jgi:hypothetical protein
VTNKTPLTVAAQVVMPPYAFEFYRVAIDDALRSAAISFCEYRDLFDKGGSETEIARCLHDALTHSAAVSRFFWPIIPRSNKKKKDAELAEYRGAKLRNMYNVDQTSPLFNRDLRNELEHFDEKLDHWLKEFPLGPIVASPIFAHHSIVDDGFGHAFKVVDTENDVFVVLGRKYEFGPISLEVARLLSGNEWQDYMDAK